MKRDAVSVGSQGDFQPHPLISSIFFANFTFPNVFPGDMDQDAQDYYYGYYHRVKEYEAVGSTPEGFYNSNVGVAVNQTLYDLGWRDASGDLGASSSPLQT